MTMRLSYSEVQKNEIKLKNSQRNTMSPPIWCLQLPGASKFEMLKVLELRGMDHKNLICQPCWPNPMPTADLFPMTASAISHQTSVGYHLLMNDREREKQDLDHWGREEEQEEVRLADALSPVERNLHGAVFPWQQSPTDPHLGTRWLDSWPVCSQSLCQEETCRGAWEIQLL